MDEILAKKLNKQAKDLERLSQNMRVLKQTVDLLINSNDRLEREIRLLEKCLDKLVESDTSFLKHYFKNNA